ncbi:tryparedoxin [Angomonas deanei]|nr:tryparedoxin [Angomonas deanei]|eukprot:EPY40136.1 tryparedoxin [Angomonas deanei]
MSGLAKYFPHAKHLVSHSNNNIALSSLAGKTVFFYFTASWCPPCRGFTPQLVEFYNKFHESKKFEIIAVTWDEKEEDWTPYYEKMPWLALEYKERKNIEFLTNGFQVQSIPTLIGVDGSTGEIITTTARNMLIRDPEGKNFPWADVKSQPKQ